MPGKPIEPNRRSLLVGLGVAAPAAQALPAVARFLPALPASNPGTDAGYWNAVRGLYSVTPDMVNLENGYWGIMAEPVNDWVARARELKGVEIQTPDDASMVAGITSFALTGKRSPADTNAIVASLRDQHKVMTVRRGGVARGKTIRISPAPYLMEADFDKFIAAVVSGNRAG